MKKPKFKMDLAGKLLRVDRAAREIRIAGPRGRQTCGEPCEVYSRVVGYYRPVAQWNKGKQAEFKDRTEFEVPDTNEQKSESITPAGETKGEHHDSPGQQF